MKHSYMLGMLLMAGLVLSGCAQNAKETRLQSFITSHVETIKPLERQAALAWWEAATTGEAEAYDRSSELTLQIRKIYSDSDDFAYLKGLYDSGQVNDPLLARQVTVLYNGYLANQIEPDLLQQIVELGTEIEQGFSTFRATIDGQKVTENEIKSVLKDSTDSAQRKEAWLASKQVGSVLADDLIRLVKLRNQAARKLGFDNFHTMQLATGEQDVKELDAIFDELYRLTNEPFARIKADLDRKLAANCNIAPDQLMPWHYHDPFFQDTPMVYELDLDVYYEDKDVKELAERFYAGIGLPVESVLAHSDLYERDGKNPHAFCTDIDREGDVRILCNLQNNEGWMETILHELGHAVYDKYHDADVPYLLREPAHAFTTEGIAMFFGRLSRNPAWMQADAWPLRRPARRNRPRERQVRPAQAARLRPLGHGHVQLREGTVCRSRSGSQQTVVGYGREVSNGQTSRRSGRARLGGQDSLQRRAVLLPQLHAGRAVRLAVAAQAGHRCAQGRCGRGRRIRGTKRRSAGLSRPRCSASGTSIPGTR